MEEPSEISLKTVCCTCLCIDRNLNQLCRVDNGVNNLFFLLSYKSTAYETMFSKDATKLFICWECNALMQRLIRFRDQACIAQSCLSDLIDGKLIISKTKCLSKLSISNQCSYDYEFVMTEASPDNFIDCGQDIDDIKIENDLDDIPLAELGDFENLYQQRETEKLNNLTEKIDINKTVSNEHIKDGTNVNYYTIHMSEAEMLDSIRIRKSHESYVKAFSKCEFCVEGFEDFNKLEKHNLKLHKLRPKYAQCEICKVYVKCKSLPGHNAEHYLKYHCRLCDQVFYTTNDMTKHLETTHSICGISVNVSMKSKVKRISKDTKTRKKEIMTDEITSQGYSCRECNKNFQNKNQRYKHIQKTHREGFTCETCGKKFPFKNTLRRHEQIHGTPLPREQCPVCGRMVRQDLVRIHARIHLQREGFDCEACRKTFVSRASYENHLKYTSSHAAKDVHRFKCPTCQKVYRSPGELRDHVNYTHMGKTTHKCPICEKALATRRCITRHVRRAHHGVKENARDKICQTCGKAFRDKKCLREHELIHTGERPLSCEICSRTFRQSASLYTHKRRVHHMEPQQRTIQHTEG